MTRACLLFATELYALPILRPLAMAAQLRGQSVAWLLPPALRTHLQPGEQAIQSHAGLKQLAPEVIYSAANWVPASISALKVQVFHGFNAEKRAPGRGHFRLRGLFDLYCTQGPATTAPFQVLAERHGHFRVLETGWPKLDPLFAPAVDAVDPAAARAGERARIMYASTFTEALSSARVLFDTLAELVARGEWFWLLTVHPKTDPALIARYRALAATYPQHALFMDAEHLPDMLRAGDVLLCDTSSAIDEFAVQLKPVVTFNNRRPKPFMLDVHAAGALEAALRQALQRPDWQMQALLRHAAAIHPSRDGQASERVLDAAEGLLTGSHKRLARKPLNLWRRWQAQRRLAQLLS